MNRPEGRPLLHQTWGSLLFLHWVVDADRLRALVPEALELDAFEGRTWVSVTPFTMWGVRPHGLPALPWASRTHELNVRTYVHRDGVPGIWFFSLDAENPLAVLGARVGYRLPYFRARMTLSRAEEDRRIRFASDRTHPGAPPAAFEASWTVGDPVPEAEPGSLERFLVERYCLFAHSRGKLRYARIHHRPWPLRTATLHALRSSMISAHGLPEPAAPPLIHAQGEPLDVDIWPLRKV